MSTDEIQRDAVRPPCALPAAAMSTDVRLSGTFTSLDDWTLDEVEVFGADTYWTPIHLGHGLGLALRPIVESDDIQRLIVAEVRDLLDGEPRRLSMAAREARLAARRGALAPLPRHPIAAE